MIRFRERAGSPDIGDKPPTLTQRWVLTGIENEVAAYAYATSLTPLLIVHPSGSLLYRQDLQLKHVGFELYYFDIPYGKNPNNNGSVKLKFSTQGGTLHIGASRETVGAYGPSASVNDHKQAIGVDGPDKKPEGADIVISALKLTASFSHPQGEITLPQIKNLARWTGKVNSDNFLTFAPGEVLFLGCDGEEGTDQPTTIDYHFACSENLSSLSIGGITVSSKLGWNLYWIEWKPATAGSSGTRHPSRIYVERVYDFVPLAACLGFGG